MLAEARQLGNTNRTLRKSRQGRHLDLRSSPRVGGTGVRFQRQLKRNTEQKKKETGAKQARFSYPAPVPRKEDQLRGAATGNAPPAHLPTLSPEEDRTLGKGAGLCPAEWGEEGSGAETAVGAQDATRGHRPCRVTESPGRQVRSESKSLNGREGNQTENSAFSLHIYNIQILTHYSSSGFSPWALRDGENSLGINAFLRILKSVRTGQVMLCPSGHKPKRVLCPETDRKTERESEQPGEQRRRRRGRWGEGAGGRGGQPCPRGLVLRVLRSSLPERVRKAPREDKATLLRPAVREGGEEQRAVPTSEVTSFQAWPLRVRVLQTNLLRVVRPRASPGPHLGSTTALATVRRQV